MFISTETQDVNSNTQLNLSFLPPFRLVYFVKKKTPMFVSLAETFHLCALSKTH